MSEGEKANVDLDEDGTYDLAVTLDRIGTYSVDLTLQKIAVKTEEAPAVEPAPEAPAEEPAAPAEEAPPAEAAPPAPIAPVKKDYTALWVVLAILLIAGIVAVSLHQREHGGLLKEIDQEMKKLKKKP